MAITKVDAANLMTGVLPVANGGTGASTQGGAANAVLPSQTGNSGKYLATDGSNASWDQINISTADITGTLPIANGGTGQTTATAGFNALAPTQTGNSGKYLTTDGTNTSWAALTVPPYVITPTNSSPVNGATGQLETPTLSSSAFYALYGATHAASQWQVSTSSGFGTTVVNTGDSASLTSYTIAGGVLSVSTTYYWRVRYKDSLGNYSDWSTPTSFATASSFSYSFEYVVLAGAGAGGCQSGAGGGAGGYLTGTISGVVAGTSYPIVIGGGGAGTTNNSIPGPNGSNSTAFGLTAIGGGGGASRFQYNGQNGGSGGGGTSGSAGSGTAGPPRQGYNGASTGNQDIGGGGGGAGGAGSGQTGGSSVSVAWVVSSPLARGGNGIAWGSGGGSNNNGAANSGYGGNGGNGVDNGVGGSGASGIVVLRYAGAQRGTGGTVTSSGGYTIHTFTTSGSYTA